MLLFVWGKRFSCPAEGICSALPCPGELLWFEIPSAFYAYLYRTPYVVGCVTRSATWGAGKELGSSCTTCRSPEGLRWCSPAMGLFIAIPRPAESKLHLSPETKQTGKPSPIPLLLCLQRNVQPCKKFSHSLLYPNALNQRTAVSELIVKHKLSRLKATLKKTEKQKQGKRGREKIM